MKSRLPLIILLALFITACAAQPAPDFATPVAESEQGGTYLQATQTAAAGATITESAAATPTSASGLSPEDWMDWPVIPEVTDSAREIYRKGIAMGNNSHAFSKIGDCQNAKDSFLWYYDDPAKIKDMKGIASLQDTINNFKGFFDRDGQATKCGFTAPEVLSPQSASRRYCLPDENPVECELRITRPTFVLISLEVWFEGRTPQTYERYMRRIIEYSISQGAVPILATKADNIEKDNSLNLVTAKLAAEYDLPLWNWWAAAQPLSDHGLDPYKDGFYISSAAMKVRSLSFLQILDHLWKGLKDTQ